MSSCSLVDFLALKIGLAYVSDLHFLNDNEKKKLERLLTQRDILDDFTLKEWQNACLYCTGKTAGTKEEALKYLLEYLKS